VAVTIRLTIRTALWRSHVASVVNRVDGPVYAFRMPEAGPSRPSAPKVRVDK
jgi:hypothetical protein